MLASLLQVLAFKRTMDGLLPFRTAADGADIAADARTVAAGLSGFTNAAEYAFDTLILSRTNAPACRDHSVV